MSLPGHDIAGPISLCKEFQKDIYKEKNIIKFWCLKKYYDDYQQLFKSQGVQIEVCAIEDLLEEEKKLDDDATNALAANLAKISQVEKMTVGELIDFKDRFSLFLLMKQPGYFFDTNVFPKEGLKLDCPSQENFTTAQSGFSGLNDFYLMYSPNNIKDNNQKLQQAFVRRLKTPYQRAGVMTFYNLSIPYLNLDRLGVQKVSYKSYQKSDVPGFFRLLELDFEKFKEHCKYADINQQVPCLFSKRLISEYSLGWLDQDLTPEIIKSLPIPTEYAYVAGFSLEPDKFKPRIYFYDKKRDAAVLLQDEKDSYSSIYSDYFPISSFKMGTSEKLNDLMHFFSEKDPNAHPPILVNIKGGTLLHHAVMSNDIEKVSWLIEMGARLDLKAFYQIQPSESNISYEYTPVQLATFLKLDAIVDLLQKHTKQATPVDSKSLKQENVLPAYPQEARLKLFSHAENAASSPSTSSVGTAHSTEVKGDETPVPPCSTKKSS